MIYILQFTKIFKGKVRYAIFKPLPLLTFILLIVSFALPLSFQRDIHRPTFILNIVISSISIVSFIVGEIIINTSKE
ncbi:MAG: hypothetical protein NC236_00450 [Mycoplasma sp.]|nr:hypothetical protein [Mycoplasma sp.]